MKRMLKTGAIVVLSILLIGLLIPANTSIPVHHASSSDWNHNTFWHEPWGSSGVHKGIDIFGKRGTAVLAASTGVVVFSGVLGKGGNAVAILGPKWRIHYFAHLEERSVATGQWVTINSAIGTLGDSGNATGKSPHVHYSILSLAPLPWHISGETQGWKKAFFLNPHEILTRQ